MPLLFAIAVFVALGLAFLVLVGPVLLVVGLIRAIRYGSRRSSTTMPGETTVMPPSPVDRHVADAAFAELITQEWPTESAFLRATQI